MSLQPWWSEHQWSVDEDPHSDPQGSCQCHPQPPGAARTRPLPSLPAPACCHAPHQALTLCLLGPAPPLCLRGRPGATLSPGPQASSTPSLCPPPQGLLWHITAGSGSPLAAGETECSAGSCEQGMVMWTNCDYDSDRVWLLGKFAAKKQSTVEGDWMG